MAYRSTIRPWDEDDNKQAIEKSQEIANLVAEAEKLLIQAEKIAKEEKLPFHYGFASTGLIEVKSESPEWYASTCSGGNEGENWEQIPGTRKGKLADYEESY